MRKGFAKKLLILFILIISFACSTLSSQQAIGGDISLRDAQRIHPLSYLVKRTRILPTSANQVTESRVAYYEARRRKGIYGEDGNIFLFHEKGESGTFRVLVCILNKRVHEVVVEGEPLASNEFLLQFIDRSLENPLNIAQDPADLLTVPSPIRPLAQAPNSSQAIALAVKGALIFGTILGL